MIIFHNKITPFLATHVTEDNKLGYEPVASFATGMGK